MRKRLTPDEWRVSDTYEASYYTFKGAQLKRVEFTPDGTHYNLFLTGVQPFMRQEWHSWTQKVNIRLYADARKTLKRQISVLSKGRVQQPSPAAQQVGYSTVCSVSNGGQAGINATA